MTSEHAADEAGGEVIYSYDGLGARDDLGSKGFPPSIPHPGSWSQSGDARGDGVDYKENVSASVAFETFAGKVYRPPASLVGAFGRTASKEETILERLGRLQQEIVEMEQDLVTSTRTDPTTASGGGGGANYSSEDDVYNDLLMTLQELKLRLARAAVMPAQETLTAHVQTVAASTNLSQTPSKVGGSSTTMSTALSKEDLVLGLELRLQRLEKWVGSSSPATGTETLSLQDRLSALEQSMSKLDEKEIEMKAKKAKVIRQDLEAASKARSKLLAASSTSSGGASASDAKIISELHNQYLQLQGLTPHLPVLVQRLQVLARQHHAASLQAQQVQSCQETAMQLTQQVAQLERAVNTTQEALEQMAQQMTKNLQALDEKLAN